MVTAIVKKSFKGVPDEQNYGRQFNPGDKVEGKLAEVAVSEGWAESTTSAKTPPKKKERAPAEPGRVSRRGRPSKKASAT